MERDLEKDKLPLYETMDYKNHINRFMRDTRENSYAKKSKNILQAKANVSRKSKFTPENILKWLENPAINSDKIVDLSNHLYVSNSLYRWWIATLAGMPTWSWTLSIDSYSGRKLQKNKVQKAYRDAAEYLDNKDMEHEFSKAFRYALKEDEFFGYEVESDSSYFIMKLDPKLCRVSIRDEDGLYGFQFNFSYFDTQLAVSDQDTNKQNLVINTYPKEFRDKYATYKRTGVMWQQLDIKNTIYWKVNDDLDFAMPYFANLFPSLMDIGFYKDIEKGRAEIDNFLLVHQQIPVDENELDKFAISIPVAMDFHGMAQQGLPEGATVVTSPMKMTAVKTERSSGDSKSVQNTIDQAYAGAGLPQQLASSTTSIGLGQAIKANEQIVYRFYRQVEKTLRSKLKKKFPGFKFRCKILDITHFNKDEQTAELLKGAQSSVVPASHVASAYGSNPYEFMNDVDLERDILGLNDRLTPLKTSHTLSASDGAGAPTKKDTTLSDSGQTTRDNDSNAKRE